MIPQLLSSSAATPGRASPPTGPGQAKPGGDTETRAFTLAVENLPTGADGIDADEWAADLSAPPMPVSVADGHPVAPEPGAGRGQEAGRFGAGLTIPLAARGQAAAEPALKTDSQAATTVPTMEDGTAPLRPAETATPAGRGAAGWPASAEASAETAQGAAARSTDGSPGAAPSVVAAASGAVRPADGTVRPAAPRGTSSSGANAVSEGAATDPADLSRDNAGGHDRAPPGDRAADDAGGDPVRASQAANGAGPVTSVAATETGAMPPEGSTSAEDAFPGAREMDLARAEPGRTDAATARTEPPRADLARTVGNQLVEAVRQGANGSTDVALNPEELGRVRLSLTAQDGVLHVSVLAERPETQDLLRRNIGMLQSDFRALGYTDVAFDFGRGEGRPDRPPETPPDTVPTDGAGEPRTVAADALAGTPARIVASTRLDLRL